MAGTTVVCDQPLINTHQTGIQGLNFVFTRNSVVLKLLIVLSPPGGGSPVGEQVDLEFDTGKYIVPFRVKHQYDEYIELITTTKKCVDWLIERYNIKFEEGGEK